jgi:hypothetical protein
MSGYIGPNGRRYEKPRKRWPAFALFAAVLMVAGVSTYALRSVKTASAAPMMVSTGMEHTR